MSENPYESPQSSIGSERPRGHLQERIYFMLLMIVLAFPTSLLATIAVGAIALVAASGTDEETAAMITVVAAGIGGLVVFGLMSWLGIYPIVAQEPDAAPPEQDE